MADLNIKFGQIPFWAICRFNERSKIELVVFSFICSKRFRDNCEGECSRSELLEYTNLDKSQISLAIKKLTAINWIEARSKTRWFIPENEPAKVDDSSTIKKKVVKQPVDDSTTKVDDSSTDVDDSTTKVDDSSTPYNKECSYTDIIHTNIPKALSETEVVVEKKAVPKKVKKAKAVDAPELVEFRKTLLAFQKEYAEPTTKGASIANAIAIRDLFALARGDTAICLEVHQFQQSEAWRNGRVDWTTVFANFNFYLAKKKNGATNGHNQNGTKTNQPYDKQTTLDALRRIGANPKQVL